MKLSDFSSLDSIKLALHDPNVRVSLNTEPTLNYTKIIGFTIDGSGFFGNTQIAFSPELNVLIGGRGVGKSAILEILRYGLDLDSYVDSDYREGLVSYILGNGGKVTIYIQKFLGDELYREYRIERIFGEESRVFELNPEKEYALNPKQIFSDKEIPLFFGQKEIYEIIRDESKKLQLIDEIIGKVAVDKQKEKTSIEEKLSQNARELLRLDESTNKKDEIVSRLAEIEHEIEIFTREGLSEKLKDSQIFAHDEVILKQITEKIDLVETTWADTQSTIDQIFEESIKKVSSLKYTDKSVYIEIEKQIQALKENLNKLSKTGVKNLLDTKLTIEKSIDTWGITKKAFDEKIRLIKEELGDVQLDLNKLGKLTAEQTKLKSNLGEIETIEEEKRKNERIRWDLIKKIKEIRHDIFRSRKIQADFLNENLKGRVKIVVEYKGLYQPIINQLSEFLHGSGVDAKTVSKIFGISDRIVDGPFIAELIRKGPDELVEKFSITLVKANKICNWFDQNPQLLFNLDIVFPEDKIKILLNFDGRDLELEKISDGQRATAMLLLLLVQSDRLLIIDQPEDDLDNRFIYDDIVRILRDQKGKRQIITATHNPNIPVLGDAELIIALSVQDSKGMILDQGAIDKKGIQDIVKSIMEGGEEAFHRRAQKYGWNF